MKEKINYFPLGVGNLPDPEPFPLPDKKILVFNHRWNKSTGYKKMIEYTKELGDDWMVWCTDPKAPKEYSGRHLSRAEYRYLVENERASLGQY